MYGLYENGDLIGVIATRSEGSSIILFFVHGKYQRKGIERKLFEVILKNSTSELITVNSSPYATETFINLDL
ncbi:MULTISPECIES: GNAT family N-acetyltransferase [Priestia]|uniref:GNAT family N-acetyltransferase n=1 Tax=Priestia TaxID=2800373 RepID=UPI001C8F0E84|nr:GNAT family N-acetyltransferase [Priestia aryabhattai]